MTRVAIAAVTALTATLTLAACEAQREAAPSAAPVATAVAAPTEVAALAAPTNSLVRVTDASQVCMVNDQYMGSAQIPVAVGGKTYFGCCAMCKEKLENVETARVGVDPVSGKPVDKASAVIGRAPSGKVFYFESEATLAQYKP